MTENCDKFPFFYLKRHMVYRHFYADDLIVFVTPYVFKYEIFYFDQNATIPSTVLTRLQLEV